MPFGDFASPLALEIQQEMAQAYFAACEKMTKSLQALKAFDRAHGSTLKSNQDIERRVALLEEAAERVFLSSFSARP